MNWLSLLKTAWTLLRALLFRCFFPESASTIYIGLPTFDWNKYTTITNKPIDKKNYTPPLPSNQGWEVKRGPDTAPNMVQPVSLPWQSVWWPVNPLSAVLSSFRYTGDSLARLRALWIWPLLDVPCALLLDFLLLSFTPSQYRDATESDGAPDRWPATCKTNTKVSFQLADRLRQNADSGNNRPRSTGGKILSLTPQQKYSHRPGVHHSMQSVISNHDLPSPLLGIPKRKWVAEIQSKTTMMKSTTQ